MKKWKKTCGILFAWAICCNSLNISMPIRAAMSGVPDMQDAPAEGISDNTEVDRMDSDNDGTAWDGVTTEKVYETDQTRIVFTLVNHWSGGYQADIAIKNIGVQEIENWYLRLAFDDEINSIWNAEIHKQEKGGLFIRNAGWNQTIPVGDSAHFGFCGIGNFHAFPKVCEVIGENVELSEEAYTITYVVESDWESGFIGRIFITNNTKEVLESWILHFDFGRQLDSIWCAVIESVQENHYVIQNERHNAHIAAGQTISFGFIGSGGTYGDVPFNYNLSFYEPGSGDAEDTLLPPDIDTDGDGLADNLEIAWGLDYENADTDGDGITDFGELYYTCTNPLLADTDEDGITDAEEDLDGDGICNCDEMDYGTNPASADTDGDNLTDYDELFIPPYGSALYRYGRGRLDRL